MRKNLLIPNKLVQLSEKDKQVRRKERGLVEHAYFANALICHVTRVDLARDVLLEEQQTSVGMARERDVVERESLLSQKTKKTSTVMITVTLKKTPPLPQQEPLRFINLLDLPQSSQVSQDKPNINLDPPMVARWMKTNHLKWKTSKMMKST